MFCSQVLYAFYKNFVYAMANVWFGCVSAMSAQPVFTTAAIATFNVLWTSLPTVAFACFDQDVSPATSLAHPELYRETSRYSNPRFLLDAFVWLVSASWHSMWCLFACLAILGDPEASTSDGKQWDLFTIGIAIFTAAVIACDLKVAVRTNPSMKLKMVMFEQRIHSTLKGCIPNQFQILKIFEWVFQQP